MTEIKRKKRVSRTTNHVKLFIPDQNYIKNQVTERGLHDKEFKSTTTAIRHYVHIGIAAEISTTDIRKSLDNSIVKRSQKEAVRNELQPIVSDLTNLINLILEVGKNVNQSSQEHSLALKNIEVKIDQLNENYESQNEELHKTLESILGLFNSQSKDMDSILRNVILLRSVLYVLVLNERKGKLNNEKINIKLWAELISAIHNQTTTISKQTLERFSNLDYETSLIQEIGKEIFKNESFNQKV